MSLYPSLEDMEVDQMAKAQGSLEAQVQAMAQIEQQHYGGGEPAQDVMRGAGGFYPGLVEYMGLELSEAAIRANMPEYLQENQNQVVPAQSRAMATVGGGTAAGGATNVVAPVTGPVGGIQIGHGVRKVILCKDAKGKIGLKVKSVDKGVFVCLVTKDSPAAMGGMKFGDQILQINGQTLAGLKEDKVYDIFKKAGVNNIVLAVRDRPFERTVTLTKDSSNHLGFKYKEGKITAIAVNTSAGRNGLLVDHNLLEINGQNVVGVKDKEIGKILDDAGQSVTLTIIPNYIYKHIVKSMAGSLLKAMDHSIPEI